jgi:hypothetical protein
MVGNSRSTQRESTRGLQIHVSKLLLVCSVAAIAATAAAAVATYMDATRSRPPGPGPGGGPPPPPPPPSEAFIISIGFFVLAWLAVLIVLSRDQVLRQVAALRAGEGLDEMEERITTMMREYGEQRETEGYVNGMRTAMTQGPGADVRPLRGKPPSARTP